jgi:hypothetical protein
VALLAYWKLQSIRNLFAWLLPYASVLFPSAIAMGSLFFKDWKKFEPQWVRWVLAAIVFMAGAVGVHYQNVQRQEKATAARINQANIDGLKGQITAAQNAQTENTKQFLGSFKILSDKVADLQTKAATEDLKFPVFACK